MLPLDTLSEAALAALEKANISASKLTAALRLDLDISGDRGETWLLFNGEERTLIRLVSAPTSQDTTDSSEPPLIFLDKLDLDVFTDPYIDNFVSSNRIILHKHTSKRPKIAELSPEEADVLTKEWNSGATSFIAGFCTNSRKQRLFTFVEIINRTLSGDIVTDDDQIFEQYHHKCPKCGKEYDDQLRRICTNCNKKGQIVSRMLGYIKPYKFRFLGAILCMLSVSALSLTAPIINGTVLFDWVISNDGKWHSFPMLIVVITTIVAIAVLQLVLRIFQTRLASIAAVRITRDMKMQLFSSLEHLSLSYFNNNPTGRLISRITSDPDRIQYFYTYGLPEFIINALNFIGLAVLLFIINWKLTLIVFAPVPIIIIIFKFMLPKLWKQYSRFWRRSSAMNSMLNDSLTGVRVVKAFAKEAEETHRFHGYAERVYQANLKANLTSLTIFPVVGLLIGVTSKAIWGFGGFEVMNTYMGYGEFCTFLGYIGMIFAPLQFFTNFTNIATETLNAAQRVFEVLDAESDVAEAYDAVELDTIKGDIEFHNVSFHYNPNRPILKNINLKVNAGDAVGLVGHSGSGKSTIANLITRMYDPISGTITIDGVDLRKIKMSSLRKNIAIVSQEIFIFRGTIADNIRYARPDAPMSDVIAAAKAANAHDFILKLPNGYETEVGTGFRSLSGGERQRISIARALLMSPSILILDEATAAMDTETERMIGEALAKLVKGRTSITIAHRLSTLKDSNYLFAIENGEIAEAGTRDELLEKRGVFYKLYTLQSESMKRVLQGE